MASDSPARATSTFCLADYRQLLGAFQALGYRDVPLEGLVPDARVMFVRHDVDLCVDDALIVAAAEQELGVGATYYFLVSTEMYNLASAGNRARLRDLRALGHRVGLHFDATRHDGGRAGLEAAAQEECAILEQLSGGPVETISFHRPAPELIGLEGAFAGRRHTYEPCFFRDVAYVSDSSGGFYRGHPLDHPAVAAGRAIQLLTHPIWWAPAARTTPLAALGALRTARLAALDIVLAAATEKAPEGASRFPAGTQPG